MFARFSFQVLVLSSVLSSVASVLFRHSTVRELRHYTFSRFIQEFNRTYQPGTDEWTEREEVFKTNMNEVIGSHVGVPSSWLKGVTKFMDYTPQEFKAVLGYKGHALKGVAVTKSTEMYHRKKGGPEPPTFINWGTNSTIGSLVKDQGSCGSCWAEAATAVMEFHMEKNAHVMQQLSSGLSGAQRPTLSVQAVLSCTENPRHCGGTGGCEGATAELGFDMVQQRGLPLAVKWPYVSDEGENQACRNDIFHGQRLGISGHEVLPSNKMGPLKRALVESGGPLVISVDASNWAFYVSGIYEDRNGEFTVNHQVVLMGFQDKTHDQSGYYLIKNSWSTLWGEKGFMRLKMKDNEEQHCGWDHAAQEGIACDGDPSTVWVCGSCGILYDVSYPKGVFLMN